MLLMLQESSTAIRSLRMFLGPMLVSESPHSRTMIAFRVASARGLQESIVDYSGTVSRIALRYAFEARICICIQRRGANVVIGGWTRDISESGICAFVAEELRLGELVTLEVPLPDSTTLNIPAKVMDSMRKRLAPSSVHCWSGSVGPRISFREGIRTRLTKGCQSPLSPSEATGRKRSGPNAEGPNCLSGSRVANTLRASWRTRLSSLTLKRTLKELSLAATSIFSVRGKPGQLRPRHQSRRGSESPRVEPCDASFL
jgi:PilZ domain